MSAGRLLIGSRNTLIPVPTDLNHVFATCSWDFFVDGERTTELEAFSENLRGRVAQLLDETVNGALSEALDQHGDPS